MEIVTEVATVTATGTAGAATGSAISNVLHGFILDIFLDYHASAPATTDVTIAYTARGSNILVVSNNATDALYHPRAKPVDNANVAITNSHDKFAVSDTLTISLAESDALTGAVTAYIHVLRP